MSRRFKNRHAKVQADPTAEQRDPVELDDENSTVDPDGRRFANALNQRAFVKAGQDELGDESADE